MRTFLLIVISFFCLLSTAQDVDKRTSVALEYIRKGYIQYGFEELKKIAATNVIAAQYYVAVCYAQGIGVEKNQTDAFKMYRKAAERGLPDAMYYIAGFYKSGIVVNQDLTRENEWLQRFNQKGGKFILPDILSIYQEGLNYSENYAINPNNANEKSSLTHITAQNTGNSPKQVVSNIPIVQQPKKQVEKNYTLPVEQSVAEIKKSDVDINIPLGQIKRESTFALIIANENYQEVEKVPNAINDGEVFAEYCRRTLGLPDSNVKCVKDVTLNGIRRQLNWLTQVMEAYHGEANIIFYYAGHGIPDESTRSAYLLPVDGFGSDVTTGYCLDNVYAELSSRSAKSVVILLDACFSGTKRDGGMLASARGVAIKSKQNEPKGNMVVLSAAQGDETAYPYEDKGHGMFTYYLLKKLQETKGNTAFGELADYVTSEVKKRSIIVNGKMQTPTISSSSNATDWRNWEFK